MTNPILVTGADGMLGSAVVRAARRNDLDVVALSRRDCDIGEPVQVATVLGRYDNPTVINCAGIVRGRDEIPTLSAAWINTVGPQILARHAGRLIQVSTDCVFNGAVDGAPFDEVYSLVAPLDAYGRSKLFGEVRDPPHLTVRVSFIGLGQRGLVHWLLDHPEGAEVPGYTNWLWNGWTASALASVLLPLAMEPNIAGVLHVPGPTVVTKYWVLAEVAARVRPDLHIMPVEAPAASHMVLSSKKATFNAPTLTWPKMLDELEEDYRLWQP